MIYLCGMNLEKEQYRVLKLLHSKCRQGFLEVSEGDEAYDELQLIISKTKTMTVKIEGPIKVTKSDNYSLVLEDANKVTHFWLPDGSYDGNCKECK